MLCVLDWMGRRLRDERTGLGWFCIFLIGLYWPLAYFMEYSAIALWYFIDFCYHPVDYVWELWLWNQFFMPPTLFLIAFVGLILKDWIWLKIKGALK